MRYRTYSHDRRFGLAAIAASAFCILTIGGATAANAADIPGSKDPAFLKRYAGSEIISSATRSYDSYDLIVPDPKDASKTVTKTLEGPITRIYYRVPAGHTALEILRNYEQTVKAGFTITYEGLPCQTDGGRERADRAFQSSKTLMTITGIHGGGFLGNPFVTQGGSAAFAPSDGAACFLTATQNKGGQNTALTVAVGEKHDTGSAKFTDNPPIVFKPGEILAMVDTATPKALQLNMTTTKAAADIPGSKDPAFLKRYAGSQIIFSAMRSYDSYDLTLPDPKDPSKTVTQSLEGPITRIFYRVPVGHTALELFRNYEQTVTAAGFTITYEGLPCQTDGGRQRADIAFQSVKSLTANTGIQGGGGIGNPFVTQGGSPTFAPSDGPACFFTATQSKGGQNTALTIAAGEKYDTGSSKFTNTPPIVFKPGETLVMVDVATPKALQINMVTVKAADMASALKSNGVFDLYGVYFDTDKSDVKPESTSTLDEVAKLLKSDASLKLEISGHTDNTGETNHNMQLSDARAKAVVAVLVSKYGIAAARLQAKGYGDTKPVAPNDTDANRAKNRRVELRKV